MAVNGIGGPRDPALETRRKQLEAERVRDLERVEKTYKEGVTAAEENRATALSKILQQQTEEIKQAQQAADTKISLAESAANDQLRRYNNETMRLTDEAQKRFRVKANQLAQTERELEFQKKHLEAQHRGTLEKLQADQTDFQMDTRKKAKAESEMVSAMFDARLDQMKKQGESSVMDLQNQYKTRKEKLAFDGDTELQNLRANQERLKEEITVNMAKQKAGEQEMAAASRADSQSKLEEVQTQAAQTMDRLRLDNQKRIREAQSQGDRQVTGMKAYYLQQLTDTERESQKRLLDLKAKTQANAHQLTLADAESKHRAETTGAYQRQLMQERLDTQVAEHQTKVDTMKQKLQADYIAQSKMLREKRTNTVNSIIKEMDQEVQNNMKLGAAKLEKAKLETSVPLNQHGARATDPFYRLHNVNATVTEGETGLHIIVAVPEHEQQNVRVVSEKNALTLTGNRRFEERAKLDSGRTITTNSYQSYSETIPVSYKVDATKMRREYAGGVLNIFIPRA